MIQLTYHIAFDAFHSTFRQLLLGKLLEVSQAIPEEQIRIVEYFLVFPSQLTKMRIARTHAKYRKFLATLASEDCFTELPDAHIMLHKMRPFQVAAMSTLAGSGHIEKTSFDRGAFKPIKQQLSGELEERLRLKLNQIPELTAFLKLLLTDYQLLGVDGLKSRTGIGEYRYDAV